MRVLLIANTLPPRDVSGVGEQVLQLQEGLRRAGVEARVLGRGKGGARGPKVLFPLTVVPAALAAVLRWRPHVVQIHEGDGALAALTARLVRRWLQPRPQIVALLQVSYRRERRAVRPLKDTSSGRVLGRPGAVEHRFRRLKAPLQILLGRWSARWADLVLAPSATTAAELEADYGARQVKVFPNVSGGLAERRPAPEEALPDPTVGALLFVGRLRIRKGVEVLLHALAELRRRGISSPPLLIAGDGEHRAALETVSEDLGLQESPAGEAATVVFLGSQTPEVVAALLARARALVVPSTYEGMPLVILEGMAAGLPVVASAVSGIPEVVVEGETGWLVPAEDVEALAAALEAVLADPEEARRRGEAGRRRLRSRYSVEAAAERWRSSVGSRVEPLGGNGGGG